MGDKKMSTRRSGFTAAAKKGNTLLIHTIRYGKELNTIQQLLKQGLDVNVSNDKGVTPLIQAIRCRGKIELVRELLKYGAQTNAHDSAGNTPLILATRYSRHLDVIKELVGHNAGVNICNRIGETSLLLATRYCRQLDVIKELLSNGADPNAANNSGDTSLTQAVRFGRRLDVIKELLKYNANANIANNKGDTALSQAIIDGPPSVIRLLLKSGANVNVRNKAGNTPLILAARHRRTFEVIKELLEFGADLNVQNSVGDSPLILAIKYCRNLEIIYEFVNRGADINVCNNTGDAPLSVAIRYCRNLELIDDFVKRGAHINVANKAGDTPLIVAVKFCKKLELEPIQELVKYGACVNPPNPSETPLNWAVMCGKAVIIKELLKSGSDTNVANSAGNAPLNQVLEQPNINLEVIQELLVHNAKANTRSGKGETPLSRAIKYVSFELCRELLTHGANPNLPNSTGETPLNQALQQVKVTASGSRIRTYREIVELLLNHGALVTSRSMDFMPYLHDDKNCAKLLVQHHSIQHCSPHPYRWDLSVLSSLDNLAWMYNYLSTFMKTCVCEIEKMREMKIRENISLLKFVITENMNPALLSNDDGTEYVKEKLEAKFPIYNKLISQKLKYAREREPLLSELSELHVYTNSSVQNEGLESEKIVLIHDIILAIAEFLSNHDLRNFITGFRGSYRGIRKFSEPSHDSKAHSKRQCEARNDEALTSNCNKRAKLE